jgi:hypothetical protein
MSGRAKAEQRLRSYAISGVCADDVVSVDVAVTRADDLLRKAIVPLETELARLTRELEEARDALTIARTTAANLHDVIRDRDRELEEARGQLRAAFGEGWMLRDKRSADYIPTTLLEDDWQTSETAAALATPQEASEPREVPRCKYGYKLSGCELGHPGCACADDMLAEELEAMEP